MTEKEFQTRLKKLGLVAQKFVDTTMGSGSIRFLHPIAGVITGVSYSQEAIDDLKELHDIDAGSEIRAEAIRLLEEKWDLIALKIIEQGDVDAFFESYTYGQLEALAEKYPEVNKIVSNPEWKPGEGQSTK